MIAKDSGQQKKTNPSIRQVLYGGKLDLNLRIVSNTVRRVARQRMHAIQANEAFEWHRRSATSLGNIHKFLKLEGWTSPNPWIFCHPSNRGQPCERELRLDTPSDIEKYLHALRTQWRYNRLLDFLSSDRHEAEAMLQEHTTEFLLSQFQKIDLEKTRNALNASGSHRSIILGSVVSDAWLHVSKFNSPLCVACDQVHGSFQHQMYECTSFPGPLPTIPSNPWTHRFGWISSDRPDQDLENLRLMTQRLEHLWSLRWGRAPLPQPQTS